MNIEISCNNQVLVYRIFVWPHLKQDRGQGEQSPQASQVYQASAWIQETLFKDICFVKYLKLFTPGIPSFCNYTSNILYIMLN